MAHARTTKTLTESAFTHLNDPKKVRVCVLGEGPGLAGWVNAHTLPIPHSIQALTLVQAHPTPKLHLRTWRAPSTCEIAFSAVVHGAGGRPGTICGLFARARPGLRALEEGHEHRVGAVAVRPELGAERVTRDVDVSPRHVSQGLPRVKLDEPG